NHVGPCAFTASLATAGPCRFTKASANRFPNLNQILVLTFAHASPNVAKEKIEEGARQFACLTDSPFKSTASFTVVVYHPYVQVFVFQLQMQLPRLTCHWSSP